MAQIFSKQNNCLVYTKISNKIICGNLKIKFADFSLTLYRDTEIPFPIPPKCCCHDNSFAAGGVLIKTEILSFVLKQKPSIPPNLMMEVKTIWELCLIQVGPCLTLEVGNGDI